MRSLHFHSDNLPKGPSLGDTSGRMFNVQVEQPSARRQKFKFFFILHNLVVLNEMHAMALLGCNSSWELSIERHPPIYSNRTAKDVLILRLYHVQQFRVYDHFFVFL